MAEFELDEATFAKATEAGRQRYERGPRAVAVRYLTGRRIRLELVDGCAFEFPAEHTQGLAEAPTATALRKVEILGGGMSVYWPELDVGFDVLRLVKGVFGTEKWMAAIGAAGGRVNSERKAEAARANGKLGGRPRKASAEA